MPVFNIYDPNPDDLYELIQSLADTALINPNRRVMYRVARMTMAEYDKMYVNLQEMLNAIRLIESRASYSGGDLNIKLTKVNDYGYVDDSFLATNNDSDGPGHLVETHIECIWKKHHE